MEVYPGLSKNEDEKVGSLDPSDRIFRPVREASHPVTGIRPVLSLIAGVPEG
jgi:hypothetical protein